MQLSLPFETGDLRKSPHIEARALPSPYVRKSPPRMATTGPPIGTQGQFLAAAEVASKRNAPLNTLITVRWRSLFSDGDAHPLRPMPTAERIRHLVELFRKWLTRNGAPPFYIWVRESDTQAAEHWHMAFHLPKSRRKAFVRYVAELLHEPARRGKSPEATEGEFARGQIGSWHLARDMRPERSGAYLAAYLGKGEPSQRAFRGKTIDNAAKPFRGLRYGGSFPDGRYDIEQGQINGTSSRKDRFFIANVLKRRMGAPLPMMRKNPKKAKPETSSSSSATAAASAALEMKAQRRHLHPIPQQIPAFHSPGRMGS